MFILFGRKKEDIRILVSLLTQQHHNLSSSFMAWDTGSRYAIPRAGKWWSRAPEEPKWMCSTPGCWRPSSDPQGQPGEYCCRNCKNGVGNTPYGDHNSYCLKRQANRAEANHGILLLGQTFPSEITSVLPPELLYIYDMFFDDTYAYVAFLYRQPKANDPQDYKGFRTHRRLSRFSI